MKTSLQELPRSEMTYRREAGEKKIDAFAGGLRQALETDSHRLRKERRTGLRLFTQLRE